MGGAAIIGRLMIDPGDKSEGMVVSPGGVSRSVEGPDVSPGPEVLALLAEGGLTLLCGLLAAALSL